jgi:hypothetical protein
VRFGGAFLSHWISEIVRKESQCAYADTLGTPFMARALVGMGGPLSHFMETLVFQSSYEVSHCMNRCYSQYLGSEYIPQAVPECYIK